MNDEQKSKLASAIRGILYLFGGFLARKGLDVKDPGLVDNIIAAIGGMQIIGAFIWSMAHKSAVAPAMAAVKQVTEGTAVFVKANFQGEPSKTVIPLDPAKPAIPLSLLIAGLSLAFMLTGCNTAKQTAYKSLATIGYGVDASMKAAADLKVQGKITQAAWDNIAGIHLRYRVAFHAAVLAAQMDYSAPASADIIALAQAVLDAVKPYLTATATPVTP